MGTQSTWGITTSTINPNQQLNQQHVSHLNHCPCSDLRSRSISRPRDGSPRSPPRTPPPRHLRTWRRLLWLRTGPLQIPRTELRPSRDEQRLRQPLRLRTAQLPPGYIRLRTCRMPTHQPLTSTSTTDPAIRCTTTHPPTDTTTKPTKPALPLPLINYKTIKLLLF